MYNDYLTQTITIQKNTQVSNNFGGYTSAWTTHLSIKGYIDLMSGSEQIKANKVAINASHILMCEVGKDINNTHRVYFNNKVFRILFVDTVFNHHMEVYLLQDGVDS